MDQERVKDREGGEAEKGGEEEGAGPKAAPPLKESRKAPLCGLPGARAPPWGIPAEAPLRQPHPQALERKEKACLQPPSPLTEVGTPRGPTWHQAQSTLLPVRAGPASSLMTPHQHPYLVQPREGPRWSWGLGGALGTFCSFLHHWLPGQECVMSPVVVTGLQECVLGEGARQGTWAEPRSPGSSGTGGTEETGRDVGRAGRCGGRGRAWPKAAPALEGRKSSMWGCVFPPKSLPQATEQENSEVPSEEGRQRMRPQNRAQEAQRANHTAG